MVPFGISHAAKQAEVFVTAAVRQRDGGLREEFFGKSLGLLGEGFFFFGFAFYFRAVHPAHAHGHFFAIYGKRAV